jgi:hypothetical protein
MLVSYNKRVSFEVAVKNKLENRMEVVGLKRSPMGLLLEALGQQEENLQKMQNFLVAKME